MKISTVALLLLLQLPSGPAAAGINAWTTTGPRGGWTLIAADPTASGTLLASGNGRLARSTDGAGHWSTVTLPADLAGVDLTGDAAFQPQAIAFDPRVPGRVYGAFGRRSLYRSDDAGTTWARLPGKFGTDPVAIWLNWDHGEVARIAVSPHDDATLHVVHAGMLWTSHDAGASWSQNALGGGIRDVAIDPVVPATLYVAHVQTGVMKSTDGGATWSASTTGLPSNTRGLRLVAGAFGSNLLYLVGVTGTDASTPIPAPNDPLTVYVSRDGARTWSATSLTYAPAVTPWAIDLQIPAQSPSAAIARLGDKVWATVDSGAHWHEVVSMHRSMAEGVAADSTGGRLYMSERAFGVSRSMDGGATWSIADHDLPGTPAGGVWDATTLRATSFTTTRDLYGGIGELLRRAPDSNTWLPPLLDPRAATATAAAFGLSASTGMSYAITTTDPTQRRVLRSQDDGTMWQAIGNPLPLVPGRPDTLLVSPVDPATLYACGKGAAAHVFWQDGSFLLSRNGGFDWTDPLAPGSIRDCSAMALDPANPGVVYVARNPLVGGDLLRTADFGRTWSPLPALPAYGAIRSIAVDPWNGNQVVVGGDMGSRVYQLPAGSAQWLSLGDRLPIDRRVRSMTVDWASSLPTVYAGTDQGVWTTPLVPGQTGWTLLPGSATLSVRALQLARPAGAIDRVTVMAATDSGVWEFTVTPEGLFTPVFRFYNTNTGAHFYTSSRDERAYVLAHFPAFVDEGVAFVAAASSVPGGRPVHRFFNTRSGVHFYTADDAERAYVIATWPFFVYEGIAYYAFDAYEPGTVKLYRFYNGGTGAHFYTTDDDERFAVDALLPQFHDEGRVYSVFAAPVPD